MSGFLASFVPSTEGPLVVTDKSFVLTFKKCILLLNLNKIILILISVIIQIRIKKVLFFIFNNFNIQLLLNILL